MKKVLLGLLAVVGLSMAALQTFREMAGPPLQPGTPEFERQIAAKKAAAVQAAKEQQAAFRAKRRADAPSIGRRICEENVREQLKAPATAVFQTPHVIDVSNDGDRVTVQGAVDAQNSFGAMVRSRYACTAYRTFGDTWDVSSVVN